MLALAGFVFAGLGLGVSHRLGLLACVHSVSPAQQAALASKYAALTYLISLAVVSGALEGNWLGLPIAAIGVFACVALAFLPLIRDAPKLGRVN
ncbi:hypothetical protein [Pseudomonas abieticivorans]|uniref:hypothetical protein n=1 Tax=Pseudomonas abieticivorans TaxID=2931382 RepID=UPI0020C0C199|nr:hypothetical protein [Pseudomonas sp. PIA16]